MTAEFSRRQMLALSAADGQRTAGGVRPGVLRPECSGKSLVMGVDLR